MSNDRINRLHKYAESLKYRLAAEVPPKHANRKEFFYMMLRIDLQKTLSKIEQLTK